MIISGLDSHPWPFAACMSLKEWYHLIRDIIISLVNAFFYCVRQSSFGRAWHTIIWPQISLLKYHSGYLVAFVASSMPMFCWACIHLRSTRLFSATSGKDILRKHLSRSGPLLMSRPLEIKPKRPTGAFASSGIGNVLQQESHVNVLAMTFVLSGW